MAANIRIIHAHEFLKATPEGHLDFELSKKLLLEIALATVPWGGYHIIIDTRKAQVDVSVKDLWYLAAELSEHREAFSGKTAILCAAGRFDQAGILAGAAQDRGFNVRAFASYEDAIEWLNETGK
jgi:hypothetical protein